MLCLQAAMRFSFRDHRIAAPLKHHYGVVLVPQEGFPRSWDRGPIEAGMKRRLAPAVLYISAVMGSRPH